LNGNPAGLGGLTPLDGRERNPGFMFRGVSLGGESPAASLAVQTLLLLVECLRRGIHQAIHLVQGFAFLWITLRIPTHAKVGTSAAMSPPIDTISRVFAQAVGHRTLASRTVRLSRNWITGRPDVGYLLHTIPERGHYRQVSAHAARDQMATRAAPGTNVMDFWKRD
jgi:hypothetical protein